MINIIIWAILILPWLILPFDNIPEPTRLIKAAFFDFFMMGIICYGIKDGLNFQYKNKYLFWFSIWVFITIALNWYYPLVRGFGYNAGTIEGSLHFILALIATFLVCSKIERDDFIRISKVSAISASLVAIFCIFQIIGLDPFKNIAHYKVKEVRHIAAMLDHPDLVGNYLALACPFFLYLKGKRYIFLFLIVLIVLFFVKSSLSLLAAFFGCLVFLLLKYRDNKNIKISIISLAIIFIGFCAIHKGFNKINSGFTGRIFAWKEFIEKDDNYLFGRGIGIAKSYMVEISGKVHVKDFWMFCHNDYLEVFLSFGALGLFLFSLIIFNAIKKFNYKRDNYIGFSYFGSFVVFLIIMFGSFPMEIAPLALGGLVSFWGVEKC